MDYLRMFVLLLLPAGYPECQVTREDEVVVELHNHCRYVAAGCIVLDVYGYRSSQCNQIKDDASNMDYQIYYTGIILQHSNI